MASKPKLTYFNFPGRAEPIRQALRLGGIDFTDNRVEGKDWGALKNSTPWGAMPFLEIDGRTIAQSNNILRFVGRRTGLYPTSYPAEEFAMAQIDELMDACEDTGAKLVPTFSMPDGPEKVAKRKVHSSSPHETTNVAQQELAEGPIAFFLERFDKRLGANAAGHNKFFVGASLTVADLKVPYRSATMRLVL